MMFSFGQYKDRKLAIRDFQEHLDFVENTEIEECKMTEQEIAEIKAAIKRLKRQNRYFGIQF